MPLDTVSSFFTTKKKRLFKLELKTTKIISKLYDHLNIEFISSKQNVMCMLTVMVLTFAVHADDSDDTTDSDASVSDVEGDADYGLDEVASDLQQSVAQEVHTDFTISYLEAMESELQILRTENLTLRMKLNAATMSDDSFF